MSLWVSWLFRKPEEREMGPVFHLFSLVAGSAIWTCPWTYPTVGSISPLGFMSRKPGERCDSLWATVAGHRPPYSS